MRRLSISSSIDPRLSFRNVRPVAQRSLLKISIHATAISGYILFFPPKFNLHMHVPMYIMKCTSCTIITLDFHAS
jgi:hypothetical protein